MIFAGNAIITLGIATFFGMGFVTIDAYRHGSLLAGIVATLMTLVVSAGLIVVGVTERTQ